MTVGERIRALRTSKGLTQAALAERTHISRGYQCRIENGSSQVSLQYIQNAADALQVPPQAILCDILETSGDSSAADQVRILIEKLPPEEQQFLLRILQRIISHLYPER